MTTKERCLKALSDNEFFQSSLKHGKMICVTHDYKPFVVEADSHLSDNQYHVVDSIGRKYRIYDVTLCYIFNDKRLSEDLYSCSLKEGTYEECKAALEEHRSHIRQCKNCDGNGKKCFYWRSRGIDEERSSTTSVYDDETDCKIETNVTVWKYGCEYTNPIEGKTCFYESEEEPKLYKDHHVKGFFLQYPEGIPDHRPLWQFLVSNSDRFDIANRKWSNNHPSVENGFRKVKKFGSYEFCADEYTGCFVLSNNRNSFYFRYDIDNGIFILGRPYRDIGYEVTRVLSVQEWSPNNNKPVLKPIACWDKFSRWWSEVISAYIVSTM